MNSKPQQAHLGFFRCIPFALACGSCGGDDTGVGSNSGSASTGSASDGSDESGSGVGSDSSIDSATGSPGGTATAVDLGMAGNFALLAKSGIATVPTSAISGDIGVSPADATYITGFALTLDASNEFSISAQVTGSVYSADYAPPTPSNMTTAVSDMETAFTDAAGRTPDVTELGAGNVSGLTLEPGVYRWGTGLSISTDVTLDGDATDVWIFQIAEDLTVGSATNVVLSGGAVPNNVFWQVSGHVDVGTTAHVEGVVLTQTSVTLGTGASVNGRLLAQTAINLNASTVVEPAQ